MKNRYILPIIFLSCLLTFFACQIKLPPSCEGLDWDSLSNAPDGLYQVLSYFPSNREKGYAYFPMCGCRETQLHGKWRTSIELKEGWLYIVLIDNTIIWAKGLYD